MDEHKTVNFKVPVEWIDRIFYRLNEIYGDKFINKMGNERVYELERVRWQSALVGCTPDEIKRTIELCRTGYIANPPHALEFFAWCKGHKITPPKPTINTSKPISEIGKQYMQLIRDKLHGRATNNWQDSVSALNQQILSKQVDKNAHWQDDKA